MFSSPLPPFPQESFRCGPMPQGFRCLPPPPPPSIFSLQAQPFRCGDAPCNALSAVTSDQWASLPQVTLGVSTLLTYVPVGLGSAHQVIARHSDGIDQTWCHGPSEATGEGGRAYQQGWESETGRGERGLL